MSTDEQEWRGPMGGMDEAQVEDFLGRGVLMRLACLDGDGFPHVFPVWHEWRDGAFWVIARQRSRWAEYMAADPRVGWTIDLPDTLEKVMGKGSAEVVHEPVVEGQWVEIAERMSYRYLGENGPTYLTSTIDQPRWLFKVTPHWTRTWRGNGWARSYWVEGQGVSWEQAHGLRAPDRPGETASEGGTT